MAAILVITFSGSHDSGATGTPMPAADAGSGAHLSPARSIAPGCASARKAVRHYAGRIAYWRSKMGAGAEGRVRESVRACPRYLAKVLRQKAYAARKTYAHWIDYHWHWWKWLPAKWQRIGACETGYGRRPGSWTWDSGTYVSAFGIYRAGYTQFAHEIGQLGWDETRSRLGRYPTPREQYNVALRIYYHFGFSGWGCRNA